MEARNPSDAARYLVRRGSETFIRFLDKTVPHVIDNLLAIEATPGDTDNAVELGSRLQRLGLLTDARREALWTSVQDAFEETGAYGFLEVEGVSETLGAGTLREFLTAERDGGYKGFGRLVGWLTEDVSSRGAVEHGIEVLDRYEQMAAPTFQAVEVLDEDGLQELREQVKYASGLIQEKMSAIEENEAHRDDHDYDSHKEAWREERYELEHGLFSDVDE